MRYVKKVLMIFALGFMLVSLISCDETASFVKLLSNISENDIKDYNGPTNSVEQAKLDIIKDIEYVSLLQEGDFKGAFLDKAYLQTKIGP